MARVEIQPVVTARVADLLGRELGTKCDTEYCEVGGGHVVITWHPVDDYVVFTLTGRLLEPRRIHAEVAGERLGRLLRSLGVDTRITMTGGTLALTLAIPTANLEEGIRRVAAVAKLLHLLCSPASEVTIRVDVPKKLLETIGVVRAVA